MARDVALPVAASALTAGLGILSFVFVAFSIINTPSRSGRVDLDREIGVFVGLMLTAGIAYGGWMAMQEEGTSFGDQADGPGGRAPPPPAARPAAAAAPGRLTAQPSPAGSGGEVNDDGRLGRPSVRDPMDSRGLAGARSPVGRRSS